MGTSLQHTVRVNAPVCNNPPRIREVEIQPHPRHSVEEGLERTMRPKSMPM